MNKLLEDPKVAALVEKETNKAVKAERKRILEAVKELKVDVIEDTTNAVERKMANGIFTRVNKHVRDAA